MDEVVLIGAEDDMAMELELEEMSKMDEEEGDENVELGAHAELIRWERFLPRMVLRVLLVESDDATRRIIAALLRKCNYRVAAVADGLEAWEIIKGRPHGIDLIITEVEMPSISGYALLSLVMEHDICKTIPVIMMSGQDSTNMVFKCMLKGAADFLIKPVRRNEMKNLWQHVWRRHALLDGSIPQNLSGPLHKVETSCVNKVAGKDSSDNVALRQNNNEFSEKGSDTQSSCTTPCMEPENAYVPTTQDASCFKSASSSNFSNMGLERHGHSAKSELDKELVTFHGGSEFTPCNDATGVTTLMTKEKHTFVRSEVYEDGNCSNEISGCYEEQNEQSKLATDLIGALEYTLKCIEGLASFDRHEDIEEFAPQLELSLRRVHPRSSLDYTTVERDILNHSTASAFSCYKNSRLLQGFSPMLPGVYSESEAGKSKSCLLNMHSGETVYTSQASDAPCSKGNMENLSIDESGQVESPSMGPQFGIVQVPKMRFADDYAGYNHGSPSMFFTQSVLPALSNTRSPCQQARPPLQTGVPVNFAPDIHKMEHHSYEAASNSDDRILHDNNVSDPGQKLTDVSPASSHSASNSLCNGIPDNTLHAAVEKPAAPESLNGGSFYSHESFRVDRLNRREAALTKFRLKRKDRCYEKKVRYQSRKRLAEQRPRVKGQFVRQMQANIPVGNSGCL